MGFARDEGAAPLSGEQSRVNARLFNRWLSRYKCRAESRGGKWMLRRASLCALLILSGSRVAASCLSGSGNLFTISGEIDDGGIRGSFTRTVDPRSGRYAEAVKLGGLKRGSGFDGRLDWSRDVSGASHYLTSDFARRLARSEAWLTTHLACPPPRAAAAATRERVDSASGLDVWRLTPAGGAPIELWYDRSGKIDRAVLQYPENRLIRHFADWRPVASGHLYPFRERDEDPEDESEIVYTVRNVSPASTTSFSPPPLPDDSKILGGSSTTIAYEDADRRRIFLPVYLNGKGPFTFELDNGGHFILTEATAQALGLTPEGAFASTGAGSEVHKTGYATVADLRVGQADVTHQPAKVLPLTHNERPGLPPRAGILGLEFFERFIVAIDHRDKKVSLYRMSDRAVPHSGRPVRLLFDEDAALAAGAYDGIVGNVMLDIGNAGPTIIEDYWAAAHGLRAKLSRGEQRGSQWISKGTVAIGPFHLGDETVSYLGPAERGSEYTRSVAAIAGEPLLSRFDAVYDYGHQTVWLNPLDDVDPHSFEKRP